MTSFIYNHQCDTLAYLITKRFKCSHFARCRKLDKPIDVLKLDCEGSEFNILRNMKDETAKRILRILGEYHHPKGFKPMEELLLKRFPDAEIQFYGKDRSAPI